jgi:hypothetical protein
LSRIALAASFKPIAATLSRHGEIPRMPCRAHPSIASRRLHFSRTVAVFSESKAGSGEEILSEAIGKKRDK